MATRVAVRRGATLDVAEEARLRVRGRRGKGETGTITHARREGNEQESDCFAFEWKRLGGTRGEDQ